MLFFILENNPSYLSDYKLGAIDLLEKQRELFLQKFSEADYEVQLTAINEVTAIQLTFDTLGKKIVAGFLVSPVISIILRKKPK